MQTAHDVTVSGGLFFSIFCNFTRRSAINSYLNVSFVFALENGERRPVTGGKKN